jgi:hypothetical protein
MHETEAERQARLDRDRQKHLKYAMEKRDRLQKELQDTDEYIAHEARLYWKYRGFTVMPRIEKLRLAILGRN